MARKTYFVHAAGGVMQGGELVPKGAEIELDAQVAQTLLGSRAVGTEPPAEPAAKASKTTKTRKKATGA